MRRTLRVGPKSFSGPNLGRRRCEGSLKRMGWLDGALPGVARLRNRNLGATLPWPGSGETQPAFHCARRASTQRSSRGPGQHRRSRTRRRRRAVRGARKGPGSVFVDQRVIRLPVLPALNSLMKEKAVQESEGVEGSRGVPSSVRSSRSLDLASRLAFTWPGDGSRCSAGAGALGQEDSLFQVRVEGELERDGAREQLSAVRAWCCR